MKHFLLHKKVVNCFIIIVKACFLVMFGVNVEIVIITTAKNKLIQKLITFPTNLLNKRLKAT